MEAALAKVEASGKDAAAKPPKADNSLQLVAPYTGGCEPDVGQHRVINAPS